MPERILPGRPRTATITAGADVLASPFQFLVSGEDNLRVRSWCAVANVRLAIDLRFGQADGAVQAFAETHLPASDRSLVTSDIHLTAGYVLNLVVRAAGGTPIVGQCYVIVDVIRGSGGAAVVLGQMLGGYVSSSQGLAWPGSPIASSLEGPGCERMIQRTTGSAAAFIETFVPVSARWRPSLVYVQYTAPAAGAVTDRTFELYLFDPSHAIMSKVTQPGAISDGQTGDMTWGRGYPYVVASGVAQSLAPLPMDTDLVGGSSLFFNVKNRDAGDSIDNLNITVTEWLEAL